MDETTISRRDLFRLTFGGGSGLALGGLLDVPMMRAATKDLKLSEVSEFTTSCNFCSCGCGMIAAVRDGKLLKMEGDYDHIVNRGSLCVKGISMFATHASPQRLTTPRYRAQSRRPSRSPAPLSCGSRPYSASILWAVASSCSRWSSCGCTSASTFP